MKIQKWRHSPLLKGFLQGAKTFLEDMASFNNFLLLSLAYFIGVGASALGMRLFAGKTTKATEKNPESYWTDLNIGGKPSDSYYRPY
jgi:hypothetical protein